MANESTMKTTTDYNAAKDDDQHPVGTMLGTVGGMAAGVAGSVVAGAATGLTAGAAVGPVGVLAGAVIGGVIGGMTGHTIAAQINPQAEDEYWSSSYADRDYVAKGSDYNTYRPAYTYGVNSYIKHEGRSFDEVEPTLSQDWNNMRGSSTLDWNQARPATQDAYDRLHATTTKSSI